MPIPCFPIIWKTYKSNNYRLQIRRGFLITKKMKNKIFNPNNCAVYCPKCKDWRSSILIGKEYGGKFKCLSCGTKTPARIVA